jgi:peptide/nickel transport system substrate-binding protein
MDLTRFEISRRTALLTSAANVVNPMRAFAQEAPQTPDRSA